MADEKKTQEKLENREKDAQEAEAILDAGEALDPFARLQKKKVAVPRTADKQGKTEQMVGTMKK